MAERFLEDEAQKRPQIAEQLNELKNLYKKKLWHQLQEKLQEAVALQGFNDGDFVVRLYDAVVKPIEDKLNAIKVAQLASAASTGCSSKSAGVQFLDQVYGRLEGMSMRKASHPLLYLRASRALALLHSGDQQAAKEAIDSCLSDIDHVIDPDPAVPASVHFAASQLHKARQNFADFFGHGLKYLAYTDVNALPANQRVELAVDLCLSSMLGENVYNFGEILSHPVIESLRGTRFEWLIEVVDAFNRGDLNQYDRLCNKYADQLNSQPALVANERKLREKITVTALLEIIFSLRAEERTMSLRMIAEKTNLQVEGVEYLIMKALSAHLIEGVIDQVEGTVRVTWTRPRTLMKPQIQDLRNRLGTWIDKVQSTLSTLEEEKPELIGQF